MRKFAYSGCFLSAPDCCPTSLMPVWRLQTVEEQRELLALDQQVTNADMKQDVEEILGTDASNTTVNKLEPVSVIQYCNFGFPNPLAGRQGRDGSTIANQLIFNARSEGITEKKMWDALVHKKRCVVLVDGFFEFHTEYDEKSGNVARKQPYFFHMKTSDGEQPTVSVAKKDQEKESPFPVMYLAAVYDASVDDSTGVMNYSFCILTCEPSKEMRTIHNRMPVVLTHEDAQKWVDVETYRFDQVQPLLKPFEGLGFYKVPPVVNNSRNHGVECIEPLDQFEKRSKASGIGRFFSPKKQPETKNSPTISSGKSLASTITATASDAAMESFFNTSGKPGQLFQPSRINPADPGQTTGDLRTATTAPSNVTSDVAMEAENFVRQVKGEEPLDSDTVMRESGSVDRKRKHESEEDKQVKLEAKEPEDSAAKRHKPTAHERAQAVAAPQ